MRLVASDNLNENYTTIVIHVNDVNDNPPVFDRPTYETQITEEDDRSLPKRVLQVKNCLKQHPMSFDDIFLDVVRSISRILCIVQVHRCSSHYIIFIVSYMLMLCCVMISVSTLFNFYFFLVPSNVTLNSMC